MLRDVLRESWVQADPLEDGQGDGQRQHYQKAFLQGMQQANNEFVLELRQLLLKIVRLRFPKIGRLAKKQAALIDDTLVLRELIVKISTAQNTEEAVLHLLEVEEDWQEEDERQR
jgi:hypothetical protein